MKILDRLYLSWIYLVLGVGIIGFTVSSIVTVHDSFLAMRSFSRYNDLSLNKVDPNGETLEQLKIVSNICFHEKLVDDKGDSWLVRSKDYKTRWSCIKEIKMIEKQGFRVSTTYDEPSVYLKGLWGDHDMSNVGYLSSCSLWLLVSFLLIVISTLLKKWLKYVFYG